MVAHGSDSPSEPESIQGVRHSAAQDLELLVDLDAQRLEGLLGRVALLVQGRRWLGGPDDLHELPGGRQLPLLARLHDPAGDALGEALLAPVAQDPPQVLLRVLHDDVPGRELGRGVHAHVQRSVIGVGEAAFALVELHGGDAEVEEDAVGGLEAGLGEGVLDLVVGGVDREEAIGPRLQAAPGQAQGLGVAVDAHQADVREAAQDGFAVPAHAERGVDDDGGGALQGGGQQVQAGFEQDGDVPVAGGALEIVHGSSSWCSAMRAGRASSGCSCWHPDDRPPYRAQRQAPTRRGRGRR